ncbi:MAG: EamA family transporter, partial [Bacteroidota bacterium]
TLFWIQSFMNTSSPNFGLLLLAFETIYIVWGSTYLANTWALTALPPFVLAGLRFGIAGSLLLGFSRLFGPWKVTWAQLRHAAFAGLLLFAIGNGLVVWSLQFVDSGIAALVVAFEPLLVVLLMWRMRRERPRWNHWLGLGLGIIGVLFLVGQPQFHTNIEWLLGVLAIFGAIWAWGYVSIWMGTADLPPVLIESAGLQMLSGGLLLLTMGGLHGEWAMLSLSLPSTKALLSLLYLIGFGSILAFTSFNYLVKHVSPTLIATSAYVNPIVALFLGWWLNDEIISTQSFLAASLLLTGVVFITWKRRRAS